jgi:hypothetical protein
VGWLSFGDPAEATLKYKRETGKPCVFCHDPVPEPEEEDPQLNREGERFRENGYRLYRLTEDQKEQREERR